MRRRCTALSILFGLAFLACGKTKYPHPDAGLVRTGADSAPDTATTESDGRDVLVRDTTTGLGDSETGSNDPTDAGAGTLTDTESDGDGVLVRDATTGLGGNETGSSDSTDAGAGTLTDTGGAVSTLTFTPTTLDLGGLLPGTVSAPKVFTITNTGSTPTGPLTVVKQDGPGEGGDASQSRFTTTCSGGLAPSETCQVSVFFSPTALNCALGFSALIVISDGNGASATGAVVGASLSNEATTLHCSPPIPFDNTINFDDTVVGQTSPEVVCTLTTGGPAHTCPQSIGPGFATTTGDFAITSNDCTGELPPNSSCAIAFAFKPEAKGRRIGALMMKVGSSEAFTTQLSGKGLLPLELVNRATDAFGDVNLGATSATSALFDVYVREQVGNVTITGTDLKLAGETGSADFVQQAGTGSPPDCTATTSTAPTPNKSTPFCQLMIGFTPQSKGRKTATVAVVGANEASDTAYLEGTGLGPLSITPVPLVFESVAIGSVSAAPVSITVCNHWTTVATGASFQVTGSNTSDFVVTDDQLSGRDLGPNATQCGHLSFRFAPQAGETVGSKIATLEVEASYGGTIETAAVGLLGDAVSTSP